MLSCILGYAKMVLLSILLSSLPQTLNADSLIKPVGKVILTLSGSIAKVNNDGRAEFDREMLEALGQSELTLETPWTEGKQRFTGVLGSKILDAVGATGKIMVARAINDYQVNIPISDLRRYPVLFALQRNGRYMRIREKGPIWIIYPRESYPELDIDEISDRWVWQLSEIIVE